MRYAYCTFYFYNESNYLKCFSKNETCEDKGYNFSNTSSKECFYSIDDCIIKNNKYIYLNNCFKYGCPSGTKPYRNSSISYILCYLANTPYLIVRTGLLEDFCPVIQLLDKTCKIINIFDNFLENITQNIEKIIYNDNSIRKGRKNYCRK